MYRLSLACWRIFVTLVIFDAFGILGIFVMLSILKIDSLMIIILLHCYHTFEKKNLIINKSTSDNLAYQRYTQHAIDITLIQHKNDTLRTQHTQNITACTNPAYIS